MKELVNVRSTPALAAALRQMDSGPTNFRPIPTAEETLPPMYRIHGSEDPHCAGAEVESAVRVVGEISERMRRLVVAYGEWQEFDASAYFDLPKEFSPEIVRVVERASTVHVLFFADLLLPTFRHAAHFWATAMLPAYQNREESATTYRHFFEAVQPAMGTKWAALIEVLTTTRTLLLEDIGFLTTSGAEDERMRRQGLWQVAPVPGLDQALAPDLGTIPTLTLAIQFALPAQKQPGRLRRLRRSRERRRAQRSRDQGLL